MRIASRKRERGCALRRSDIDHSPQVSLRLEGRECHLGSITHRSPKHRIGDQREFAESRSIYSRPKITADKRRTPAMSATAVKRTVHLVQQRWMWTPSPESVSLCEAEPVPTRD